MANGSFAFCIVFAKLCSSELSRVTTTAPPIIFLSTSEDARMMIKKRLPSLINKSPKGKRPPLAFDFAAGPPRMRGSGGSPPSFQSETTLSWFRRLALPASMTEIIIKSSVFSSPKCCSHSQRARFARKAPESVSALEISDPGASEDGDGAGWRQGMRCLATMEVETSVCFSVNWLVHRIHVNAAEESRSQV